mmetsp:Transcript_40398/g.59057  ORF Transcript_40398/g.59057 Transcript_40398/m.59057 type:complete len:1092 (+) Transcript_40398:77-3352(+)
MERPCQKKKKRMRKTLGSMAAMASATTIVFNNVLATGVMHFSGKTVAAYIPGGPYSRFKPSARSKAAVPRVNPLFDAGAGEGFFFEGEPVNGHDFTATGENFTPDGLGVNAALNGKATTNPANCSMMDNKFEKPNPPSFAMEMNGKEAPVGTDYENNRPSPDAPTAPEVNQWTTLMADGTNAAIHRPGKEMTIEEGMEILYNDLRDMSYYDNEQVETYWDKIMPTICYLGTKNVAKIKNALRVAYRAHRGQMRKSGEPFVIHPVEVALLLSELKMDAETVMAGLLHDTVEDTDLTFTQVEAMFGKTVKAIVEGETKVSKLPKLAFNGYADEQAENLRQMFVAMTEDYRIIIVKLADRLHNMRTLRHMKPAKQQKISRETLDIFAPLAHRMGIWQFKSELEDTSFMYLYPKQYKDLNRKLRRHQTKFRETLDKSQEALRRTLESDPTLREQSTSVQVCGRTKELYSLWHKMETKAEENLEHIADVVALRVILEPKKENEDDDENDTDRGVWLCYHVLGLVQHLPGFQPVPTRVKDYISFPKPNGYQSLHTALMLNGQTVEVQIRTAAMHRVAEYGMASHWAYTDGKKRSNRNDFSHELYNTPWLASIKEWQNDVVCSRDFVDSVRRELLGKRVFVFLRNGKILNLARGATVIDAAFQIHTEVGLNMHGVEINGKRVPFSYELQNGDVVSILTGGGKPEVDWMRFAKSRSTRSKLRSYFRTKQRESLCEAGQILFMDFLSTHGDVIIESSFLEEPFEIPTDVTGIFPFLPGKTRYSEVEDLLIDIGKRHDRSFLLGVISKLFLVPLSTLVTAEESRKDTISSSVVAAVHESRQLAKNVAKVAGQINANDPIADILDDDMFETSPMNEKDSSPILDRNNKSAEIADPEHLCQDCLPVRGDNIVGTRPIPSSGFRLDDVITTVHRCGCMHAQQAINNDSARNNVNSDEKHYKPYSFQNKSEFDNGKGGTEPLRLGAKKRFTSNRDTPAVSRQKTLAPVKLQWSEPDSPGEEGITYYAEIVIVASDRKLLLADCSEVVSEMTNIVKTGSITTDEHAILEFLVQVENLEELQKVMDQLTEVHSVMSVERRFGSKLYR